MRASVVYKNSYGWLTKMWNDSKCKAEREGMPNLSLAV